MTLEIYSDLRKAFEKYIGQARRMTGRKNADLIAKFNLQETLQKYHAIGIYAYLVADNSRLQFIEIGGAFEQLTGFNREEVIGKNYTFLLKVSKVRELIKRMQGTNQYFDYLYNQPKENRPFIKVNSITTLIKKDKSEILCLNQSIPLQLDDAGDVLYFLNIMTDVTELFPRKTFEHYLIDSSDVNNIKRENLKGSYSLTEKLNVITDAELKVLKLLALGKSSKQIADTLKISTHTVNNHRKNMLAKLQCASSSELIKVAYTNGWI